MDYNHCDGGMLIPRDMDRYFHETEETFFKNRYEKKHRGLYSGMKSELFTVLILHNYQLTVAEFCMLMAVIARDDERGTLSSMTSVGKKLDALFNVGFSSCPNRPGYRVKYYCHAGHAQKYVMVLDAEPIYYGASLERDIKGYLGIDKKTTFLPENLVVRRGRVNSGYLYFTKDSNLFARDKCKIVSDEPLDFYELYIITCEVYNHDGRGKIGSSYGAESDLSLAISRKINEAYISEGRGIRIEVLLCRHYYHKYAYRKYAYYNHYSVHIKVVPGFTRIFLASP